MGYTFYFASSGNQALFEANPSQYAPAYGGFCAYGVSGYDGNNYMSRETQLWSTPVDVNEVSERRTGGGVCWARRESWGWKVWNGSMASFITKLWFLSQFTNSS